MLRLTNSKSKYILYYVIYSNCAVISKIITINFLGLENVLRKGKGFNVDPFAR